MHSQGSIAVTVDLTKQLFRTAGLRFSKAPFFLALFIAGMAGGGLQPLVAESVEDALAHETYVSSGDYAFGTMWVSTNWKGDRISLANRVQSKLAPLARAKILSENIVGPVDILLSQELRGLSGFWSSTLMSPSRHPSIALDGDGATDDNVASTAAHELIHYIHQGYRPSEESWVREGLALLGEYVVTQRWPLSVRESYLQPESSLVAAFDPSTQLHLKMAAEAAQYGHLALFFIYLYRNCGEDAAFADLLKTPRASTGISFLESVLKGRVTSSGQACNAFDEIFKKFELARLWPKYTKRDSYIFVTRYQPELRDRRVDLPAYSAGLYKRKPDENCKADEDPLDSKTCLRIRFADPSLP